MQKNYRGQVYLALAASIWGGLYVVSKVVLTVIPPLELVWLRYVIALAALALTGIVTRQSWRIQKKDVPLVLGIGIIGYFLSIWAQFTGTKLSSAQMGAMITSATPAFMVLFGRILLKEKITLRKGVSVCLATMGVLLIVGVGAIGDSVRLGGAILGLAALSWALMSVLVKQVPRDYSQLVVTTYAILAATVVMTPFVADSICRIPLPVFLEPAVWGGILYIGVVSTAGAFYFWNKGLQTVDAARGGIYFFFQPLTGTLLGWLLLGEQVGISFWLGTLLICSGVLLVIKPQS
ncbi:Hypothetical protein LUCI_2604 [Lucifera butyrica]|uniref:EamA domain-containing protein n=1 Tax=Lucifera butyrica TaxID=1351585 RepID=A0A498R8V5_9FIRM|nr:DMT family transporter [Lucifera butyrica]VBB07360.1 Hypothetical protein LUCI_2604 [Lucifera butyrica]